LSIFWRFFHISQAPLSFKGLSTVLHVFATSRTLKSESQRHQDREKSGQEEKEQDHVWNLQSVQSPNTHFAPKMSSAGSPGQSSAAKAEEEMRYLKLDAIEKGLVTDFSFIVGPDKETAEVRVIFS